MGRVISLEKARRAKHAMQAMKNFRAEKVIAPHYADGVWLEEGCENPCDASSKVPLDTTPSDAAQTDLVETDGNWKLPF